VSFVMFTFIISAAFHLIVKLHNIGPHQKAYTQIIDSKDLVISNLTLPVADSVFKSIAVVKIGDSGFYQVSDLSKNVSYFNTKTGTPLADGDKLYAKTLADFYHVDNGMQKVYGETKVTQVRQFDNEYGFINK
ncbi:hypothetical protein, partial [Bradyrhizobium sp. NBAIM08]|uniref:hypothetical protein n=1 Tax=Bradyrhizobium sp. NBAIM08 TaxID=2793815 RepID=UPI001CD6CE6B